MFINRKKTALKPDQADLNGGDADDGVNENIHPDKNNSADSSKAELNDSETGFEDHPAEVCKDEKKIKERTLLVFCNTKSKTFLADMTNVVFQKYGTVKSAEWQSYRDADHQVLSIVMYSSEVDAVRCIHDTNNISYKGQSLRVKFEEGSVENSLPFRGQYLNLFRNYPDKLIPEATATESTNKKQVQNQPIGILPPTSSLGGFGALPDISALTSIIENVRRASQQGETEAAAASTVAASTSATSAEVTAFNYSMGVEGSIYSVNSKIVLIKFFDGNSHRLAKMIPGQMFIDGKICLGYVIKNDPFQQWPPQVKTFLQLGSKVQMDVNVLSEAEAAEVSEFTSEVITYSAPLIWRNRPRPADQEMTISRLQPGVCRKTFFPLLTLAI